MKVLTVIGARPQFIKCGPVSVELRVNHQEVLVHTGQHYDTRMSEQFFRELNLPLPDYNLGVGSGSHGFQTGAMLQALEEVLHAETPDVVLVYGDTNSTLAGSLAAAKMHLPVAHVEAGLRSFNQKMPEEINRVITDHVSTLLFCPTVTAVQNLEREGITRGVYLTGDVMYDAALKYLPSANEARTLLEPYGLVSNEYYLATVHRAENTDVPERLHAILEAFSLLDLPVLFSIHPRTRDALSHYGWKLGSNIRPLEPLGYRQMLAAQQHARAILTDSGGVQKEAFFLKKPCITLRDETEWIETVNTGWNVLVGANRDEILHQSQFIPAKDSPTRSPFGQGNASRLIVDAIEANYSPSR